MCLSLLGTVGKRHSDVHSGEAALKYKHSKRSNQDGGTHMQ